jgi:hypothetical protein
VNLAQWISPHYDVLVSGVMERYHRGDLTLAGEVVQQHDRVHGTTSAIQVVTKRRADIELDLLEAQAKRAKRQDLEEELALFEKLAAEFPEERDRVYFADVRRNLSRLHAQRLLALPGGEATVEAPREPTSIALVAQRHGWARRVKGKETAIGKRLKALYEERHGRVPPKHTQYVNGQALQVNSYTTAEEDLIERAIREVCRL